MLQVRGADMPVQDMEGQDHPTHTFLLPDWGLLSFNGLMGVLQVAVSVFTKVHYT